MQQTKLPFTGYACEFSPFDEKKLAVSTAQHFGVVGNGRQHIFDVTAGGIRELCHFDTRDAIYDCCWSEQNENQLVGCCGDGSVKLWDIPTSMKHGGRPIAAWKEHTAECQGVDWNLVSKDTFLSCAWDHTVKLWSPQRQASIFTFGRPVNPTGAMMGESGVHTGVVYDVVWSPYHDNIFASVSEDTQMMIWDKRRPKSVLQVKAHQYEVLTCDFNKYNENIIATGSCDTVIAIWDLRRPSKPLTKLHGHKYAVRRLKWSPHSDRILCSCSYDMSVCVWDYQGNTMNALLNRFDHHTEFVLGVGFNQFREGMLSTVSWDHRCTVFPIQGAVK